MKTFYLIITLIFFLSQSCNTNQNNERIRVLELKIDSLMKMNSNQMFYSSEVEYDSEGNVLFKINEDGKYYLNNHFYVSNFDTSYIRDGYRITGTLYNYSSLDAYNVILSLSIADSVAKFDSPVGTNEIEYIYNGTSQKFSFYIPNSKQSLFKIRMKVLDYTGIEPEE